MNDMFCQDIATNWLLTAGSYLLSFPTFTFSLSLSLLSRTQWRWYVMSGHCHRLTSCCWFLPYRFPPKCLFVLFLTFSAQIYPRQCVNKIWLFTPFMASEFGIKKTKQFFTSIYGWYTHIFCWIVCLMKELKIGNVLKDCRKNYTTLTTTTGCPWNIIICTAWYK